MKPGKFAVPGKTGALAFLALAMTLAVPAEAQNVLTAAEWREDLKNLAVLVPKAHRNAFHSISQDSFTAAVAEIDRQIPSMSDYDAMVAIARLVAMLGDGHSRVSLPGLIDPMSDRPSITQPKDARLAFHQLPVKLHAFSNGLFVIAATNDFKQLLGAQVLQIGAYPVQKALEAVYPIVNRDNEMGLKLLAPHFVTVPEILRAQHIVQDASQIPVTFQTRDGKKVSIVLTPLAPAAQIDWKDGLEDLGIPEPLRLREPDKNYWFEYLSDSKTIFVRINVIEDSRAESIAQFARRLHSFVESNPVDRVAIDIRDCHGGDNQMFRSLLLSLIREAKIDVPGKLFVMIGRNTFSAAVNAASDLERLCDCIFVGEPTVGSPSSYGDAHVNTLPDSGLVVRLSTVYWRDWTGDESRPWIAPDISVVESSQDYFAGKDPSLQAVLDFQRDAGFDNVLMNVVRAGGNTESVMRLYYRQKTDARSANESTREAMQRLGAYFVSKKQYKQALLAFQINARDYPDSVAEALRIVDEARSKDPQDELLSDFAKKMEMLRSKR
ncbi:MAG TPA: hypothetical protein VKP58_13800 [Candidatus Acidoferrum sp.]|nr:hypothetical protein [Candidatus Acidoferrum sp.]